MRRLMLGCLCLSLCISRLTFPAESQQTYAGKIIQLMIDPDPPQQQCLLDTEGGVLEIVPTEACQDLVTDNVVLITGRLAPSANVAGGRPQLVPSRDWSIKVLQSGEPFGPAPLPD